jgi:hypothetical protein
MEYAIRFGAGPADVEVVTSGEADASGFIAFIAGMVSDPRYRPGMAILLDHGALDLRPLGADDVRKIAAFVAEHDSKLGGGPCAAVQPTTLGYGFALMRHLLNDGDVSLRWRVFREREAALEWLAARRAGGADR